MGLSQAIVVEGVTECEVARKNYSGITEREASMDESAMESGNANLQGPNIFSALTGLIRIIGIVILIIGLWTALKVVYEAWELYKEPGKIEVRAKEVEKAAHINSFIRKALANKGENLDAKDSPNISYFATWAIAVILLLVIARIGIWAIVAGGKLVVYNGETEKVARAMIKQIMIETHYGKTSH